MACIIHLKQIHNYQFKQDTIDFFAADNAEPITSEMLENFCNQNPVFKYFQSQIL